MKLAGSEGEVDDIGDCGNKYGWTFFKKPGRYGIWVGLLVWTVGQDLVDFGFRGRGENWEVRVSGRKSRRSGRSQGEWQEVRGSGMSACKFSLNSVFVTSAFRYSCFDKIFETVMIVINGNDNYFHLLFCHEALIRRAVRQCYRNNSHINSGN